MSVKPLDTLIAIKAINLMPGLRLSDRRVGVALIEHFNRRTGRCDPGIDRLAELIGFCVRTIIRSTQRLEAAGLFRKVRHGGYSNRNSYEPIWSRFAELESAWRNKMQEGARLRRTSGPSSPRSRPPGTSLGAIASVLNGLRGVRTARGGRSAGPREA